MAAMNVGSNFIKPIRTVFQTPAAALPAVEQMLNQVVGGSLDLYNSPSASALNAFGLGSLLPDPVKSLFGGDAASQVISAASGSNSVRDASGIGDIALSWWNNVQRMGGFIADTFSGAGNAIGSVRDSITDRPNGLTGEGLEGSNILSNAASAFTSSDKPPKPLTGDDAMDVGKQNKFNADMFAYQQRLANMQMYWQMISTIQKSADDTRKAMIQNLR